ncbi:hypothetical protein [Klebsiella pneumoniae]|uniref:hypothetical protein n=1 Tax=Klebsiella pneumoniae TaxID=573 RepID=UPI001157AC1C|nr:hypothetical protein [Klebsiella pneumoniae]
MTKSTITRERLEWLSQISCRDDIEDIGGDEIRELASMALAAMDGEPVEFIDKQWTLVYYVPPMSMGLQIGDKLYRYAQPAPVVPEEATPDSIEILASARRRDRAVFQWDEDQRNAAADSWNACRAAMLQAGTLTNEGTIQAVNSPVIPDGYVMVPMRLTAENGAKGALSGEFSETKFVNCPECFGDDECETCDGSGRIEITVPVTWATIKEIWAKGVEHFAAAPQEVKP